MVTRGLVLACATLLALTTGCASVEEARGTDERPVEQVGDPVAEARLGGTEPGSLVSATRAQPVMPPNALLPSHAARVVYVSTNGDTGKRTQVSGSVFVPAGQVPEGGWPVIAYAHGNTGFNRSCAPSLSTTYGGFAPQISSFVGAGFAVAMPDYQGLGEGPPNPFLDARTEGLNLIDSVRALRAAFPDVSNRWGTIGGSQGGGAVWGATEEAGTYADELDLVGGVSLSPPADLSGLVDKSLAGTMTREQTPALQGLVEALARIHPSLDRDDYRSEQAARDWEVLSACDGELQSQRDLAVRRLGPDSIRPRTAAAAYRLRGYLTDWALPHRKVSAPLYVVFSSTDPYVDSAWTAAALQRACALGGRIRFQLQTDRGHADLEITHQISWLVKRFAGSKVRSDCP